ncbi:Uncharacterized protein FWK35_00024474 [Aphis craccivora]|uniref:Uncharacterized protein n=1 Tax=Aphis craccivora TaxID=307492 RepID=A0A6G0Z475_APHCR|nr:Uncharacterized protein FWK35_00024474 [Aphis craccivora]
MCAYCSGPFDIIIILLNRLRVFATTYTRSKAYVQTQWAVCVCTYYIYNVLTPDSGSDLFIVSYLLSMVVENRFVCDTLYVHLPSNIT